MRGEKETERERERERTDEDILSGSLVSLVLEEDIRHLKRVKHCWR